MPTIWLNINAKEPCNEENLYFDILAQPTKFPTIFSQSNGFRLTRLNEEKSGMIKKNLYVSEKEEEEQSGKGKGANWKIRGYECWAVIKITRQKIKLEIRRTDFGVSWFLMH